MLSLDDAKALAGYLAAGALGALGLWAKTSSTRLKISEDSVKVNTNASQSNWLADMEARLRQEYERRLAAEAALASANACIRECELKVTMRDERIVKLEKRVSRLVHIVSQMRPELQGWLVTEPGEFNDAPEIKIVNTNLKGS